MCGGMLEGMERGATFDVYCDDLPVEDHGLGSETRSSGGDAGVGGCQVLVIP